MDSSMREFKDCTLANADDCESVMVVNISIDYLV